MKYLKLVINNKKNLNKFFNKKELQTILDLYAQMVSTGEWKDYGLHLSKQEISFNIYKRSSEVPVYKIMKSLNPKNENNKYFVKDSNGNIIKSSENLKSLIQNVRWARFKLVN